jgi:hypothetical protein
MELPEGKKKEHRDDVIPGGDRVGSILPGISSGETDHLHAGSRSSDCRGRGGGCYGPVKTRNEPYIQNKSEKEVNSIIQRRINFSISLSRVIQFFKTLLK